MTSQVSPLSLSFQQLAQLCLSENQLFAMVLSADETACLSLSIAGWMTLHSIADCVSSLKHGQPVN